LRFPVQSLLAGLDVARRALDPRLPVSPTLLQHRTALPPGTSRTLFGALSSQVPGTLTVDLDEPERLLYHCLDRPDRAARGLAADEALFRELLGQGGARGRGPPA
jgi:multicomponent Na+:H+ antiporter subunit E